MGSGSKQVFIVAYYEIEMSSQNQTEMGVELHRSWWHLRNSKPELESSADIAQVPRSASTSKPGKEVLRGPSYTLWALSCLESRGM